MKNHRSGHHFQKRPKLLGDAQPGLNGVQLGQTKLAYVARTNSQGLRHLGPVKFPKNQQRILCMGDSFTYGPYLPDQHTYPWLLQKMLPDAQVINAGSSGRTLCQELEMFMERSRFLEPDIVVLQIFDNDLYDYFYFKRTGHDRKDRIHHPNQLESELLRSISSPKKPSPSSTGQTR